MTAAAAQLNARLRAFALRLHARRLTRAVAHGAVRGCAGALAGVLLLHALPMMLGTGLPGAHWLALAFGVCVFIVSTARTLARDPAPDLREAALSLEARLTRHEAVLSTALEVAPDSAFLPPLISRADAALRRALALPAPHMLPTRELLALPLALVMATTALVWAAASGIAPQAQGPQQAGAQAFSIDVQRQRDAADAQAAAQAMGLKQAAASMRNAAQAMRSETATQQERQAALDRARKAAQDGGDQRLRQAASELPETAPTGAAQCNELASRLENIALGAGERADKVGGTTDSGRDGVMTGNSAASAFVALPAIEVAGGSSSAELASQTPQRRELVSRAMAALEE